jgi:hypothetical protein
VYRFGLANHGRESSEDVFSVQSEDDCPTKSAVIDSAYAEEETH